MFKGLSVDKNYLKPENAPLKGTNDSALTTAGFDMIT